MSVFIPSRRGATSDMNLNQRRCAKPRNLLHYWFNVPPTALVAAHVIFLRMVNAVDFKLRKEKLWCNLKNWSHICPKGLRETTKYLIHKNLLS